MCLISYRVLFSTSCQQFIMVHLFKDIMWCGAIQFLFVCLRACCSETNKSKQDDSEVWDISKVLDWNELEGINILVYIIFHLVYVTYNPPPPFYWLSWLRRTFLKSLKYINFTFMRDHVEAVLKKSKASAPQWQVVLTSADNAWLKHTNSHTHTHTHIHTSLPSRHKITWTSGDSCSLLTSLK